MTPDRYELWDGRVLEVHVSDEDPGDMGEPRSVTADDVVYLAVRARLDGRDAVNHDVNADG